MLRPPVSRLVRNCIKHLSEIQDHICIIVRPLGVAADPRQHSHCRVRVPRSRNHARILLSQIRDSTNLEAQAPVFISPMNRVVQLCLQALGSHFHPSYDSQCCDGSIGTCLFAGVPPDWVELTWVYLTADGQSIISFWYRSPLLGPWPDFILILSLVTNTLLFFL
jgi:hypothetical protein